MIIGSYSRIRVMPKLAIRSAIWILTLFFHLIITKKMCPKENLDLREDRPMHSFSENFWKQKLFEDETVVSGIQNKISRFHVKRNTDLKEKYKNTAMRRRTLMDYKDPVITENLDDTSDQDLTSHVRVKRNNPSIHQSNDIKLIDLFSPNFRQKSNATEIFSNSSFKKPHSNRSNIVSYLRRKRGTLLENRYRKKRVKGNFGHSKYYAGIKNEKKKQISHQSVKKKIRNPSSKKRSKNIREIRIPTRMDEIKIKKREFKNSELNSNINDVKKTEDLINEKRNALLANNKSLPEPENTVMLPFVHTGRAELHVRIKKPPTNKSSIINSNYWMDYPIETSICSTALPKYNMSDEIFDINVTNLEFAPNFDSKRGKIKNLTMEISLKKLNHGYNTSILETNVPKGTYPNSFNLPEIENKRNIENRNYDRTKQTSVESLDEKSRAKRNQEITSKHYPQNKSVRESKHSKDHKETSTRNIKIKNQKIKYKKTRGSRAVKSIEEIKDLAEKLIVKINKLQIYMNNHNETLHIRNVCKNRSHVAIEEKPKISLEKKNVSNSMSKTVNKNINSRQRYAKEILGKKRIFQSRSDGSRFARSKSRMTRKSRRKWGRWMDWSSCSVTCGKGRQIRWRHCLHDCNDAETEMEEKACQLPACPPEHGVSYVGTSKSQRYAIIGDDLFQRSV